MWRRRQHRCKQTPSFAKVKLLYARITLTRYTTLYFFFAVVTSALIIAQQTLTFLENGAVLSVLSSNFNEYPIRGGIILLENGVLEICDGLPNQPDANCTEILTFAQNNLTSRTLLGDNLIWSRNPDSGNQVEDGNEIDQTLHDVALSLNETLPCRLSLKWLDNIIHDARREDVITLVFQIWLLSLAIMTVLWESIPHLGAAILGHVLVAGWSCYRLSAIQSFKNIYQNQIVPKACSNLDLIGDWWDIIMKHAILIVVVNALTVISLSYLSFKLFKVYAKESFSRVGVSPQVNRMYKLALFFSVCQQLTGFFSLASTGLWLDTVFHMGINHLTKYPQLFKASVIIELVIQVPWVFLGCYTVQHESVIGFRIFAFISLCLLGLSLSFLSSLLYRYFINTCPFFATIAITAFVLLVMSSVLSVLCRLNFGKGLAHYFRVTEALAGVDFTPVHFPKNYDVEKKADAYSSDRKAPHVQIPALTYFPNPSANSSQESLDSNSNSNVFTQTTKHRWSLMDSKPDGSPILLSSSSPLLSELGPVPARFWRAGQSQRGSTEMPLPPVPIPVPGGNHDVQVKGPPSPPVSVSGPPGIEGPTAPSIPILVNKAPDSSSAAALARFSSSSPEPPPFSPPLPFACPAGSEQGQPGNVVEDSK